MQSLFFFAKASCSNSFLGFPTWYHYLKLHAYPDCSPNIQSINAVWLIVAAVIEILLRVAAIVAVVMVIYGGFTLLTSQGEPEPTKQGRNTVINALIGLAIAIMAAVIVSFIAKSIS